jgi:hypothetical protein
LGQALGQDEISERSFQVLAQAPPVHLLDARLRI